MYKTKNIHFHESNNIKLFFYSYIFRETRKDLFCSPFCTRRRLFGNLLPQNAPLILKIEFGLLNENNVYLYRVNRHIIFFCISLQGSYL